MKLRDIKPLVESKKETVKKPMARKYAEEEETVVPEEKPEAKKTVAKIPPAKKTTGNKTSTVDAILEKLGVQNYEINSDGTVTVNGDVSIVHEKMKKLPVQFKDVKGNFDISTCELETLEGCPQTVKGHFHCIANKLNSLEHAPKIVLGDVWCMQHDSKISLQHVQKYIKQMDGELRAGNKAFPVESPVLGVFFIKGLKKLITGNPKADEIINKHLAGERDVHLCQGDLTEAGFAKLANA